MTDESTGVDYRRYRRRRRRWPYVVVAAVSVLAAVGAWQLLGAPRVAAVTPGPDAYVRQPKVTVDLQVSGLSHLRDVRVTFAGKDVTAASRMDGDRLSFPAGELADGTYTVTFSARSSNLFRNTVNEQWQFTVDTKVPTLELDPLFADGKITTDPAVFSGSTEPGSTVTVKAGELKAAAEADSEGRFSVAVTLPDGPTEVTVSTRDRAGNSASRSMSMYVDSSPPTLKVSTVKDIVKHAGLKVRISARDVGAPPKLYATIDDQPVKLTGTASSAVLKVKNLAQGRHTLVVKATDRGGNEVKDEQTFITDSTEHFGSHSMGPGARGKDVRELQRRLAAAGVFRWSKTGQYGEKTETAVRAFQKKFGLPVDGLVGPRVLTALSGQIVIDLSSLKLLLYRDGKLLKTYRIAAGSSQYPTPTGTYSVTSMITDPTWYPPNSEWAKDAKPIPPGVANPLGTRWIGTSAPNVGIHGTPDSGSIGTYASHGCIRMYISEVEDLYERVAVGMPVVIRQ